MSSRTHPEPIWNWKEGSQNIIRHDFTGDPGVNVDLTDSSPIIDYFLSYYDEAIHQNLYEQTNLFAQQRISKGNLKPYSRLKKWTPTSDVEMKRMLGMTVGMGLTEQREIVDYWSSDPLTETPFYGRCMSRDRFLALLSNFHLNDNTKDLPRDSPDRDKLFKIRPFIDALKKNFESVYIPSKQMAIDEATIPWRGNLSFRVYNPDKPHKFGIKIYELCDRNGICVRFEIYSGKVDSSTKGAIHDLIMRLMEPYLDQGYDIFFDNFYNSPQLVIDLLERGKKYFIFKCYCL